MPRTRRKYQAQAASVDMTPMLDIVFIMLIFFIVTAVFLDERGLTLTQPSDGAPSGGHTIQIYVDESNHVSIDNVAVSLVGVSSRIETLLADKPNANILLLTHHKARLDPIIYIKDMMNIANRPLIIQTTGRK